MTSAPGPPDRQDRREEARRARLVREEADTSRQTRRRRLRLLGAIAAVAAVAVGIAIVATSGGGGGTTSPTATAGAVAGAAEVRSQFAGIPQQDIRLGQASAPARVIEFADPQCPFCRDFAVSQLPALLSGPVRGGQVRMEFRALAFIGPDSEKAARFIEAAALQNRAWYAAELLYDNQGAENSGWVTDALLRSIAGAIPGLNVSKVFADAGSASVTSRLKANQALAVQNNVNSTPTFLVGRGNTLKSVSAAQLDAAIQAALKGR